MADEIQRLKTDIALNQTLIFVGTHVSFHTTNSEQETAYWKGLLRHGLERCHQLGYLTNTDFKTLMNKFESHTVVLDDYLSIANRIKDCLKKKSHLKTHDPYKSWLSETIGQLLPKRPALIRAIGELECPILTTNYDSLLCDILQRKVLTWNSHCTDIGDMNSSILHLFGHFQEPDTIIFSKGDYKRLSENVSGLFKLKSLLKTKTLLFIGYDTNSTDLHFSHLLKWISQATAGKPLAMYRLIRSNRNENFNSALNISLFNNIKDIHYGTTSDDLLFFIRTLKSLTPILRDGLLLTNRRERIRTKYLCYLIEEYGYVSIFGSSNANVNLPLGSVYVELKFDPTHPSIKAMQTLEINEEFKRKILSDGFFDTNERSKIIQAILERNAFRSETIYRDFMVEQWLNVFLSNRNIFTTAEAQSIKNKIHRLKQNILQKNSFQEIQQYRIQRAYQEFKHFLILGHPGSGKTTLSKWLVVNMAKQCLSEENMLFDQTLSIQKKIPILIPIWKYVDQVKQTQNLHKKTLLEFISENAIWNSPLFNDEERTELSLLMMESFIQGHVLVIFEGLDEVPAHVDRTDLMKDINTLLEKGIDYDPISHRLIYSIHEQKEINNIKDPHIGNRFIITSRIEGNYFEDINFYIPRLTIENMSNEALKLFCRSYMQCIQRMSNEKENQLYDDISQNKDIFQLAINPQLASVIASIYSQCNGQLPERRIDLYQKAIETIIERLVTSSNHLDTEYRINPTMLWSILQEVAQYLHSKVEGLSERVLQEIISKYLIEQEQLSSSIVDDSIFRLVNIFKYQAGLLNEFGQNSFRFIHRTFQEYLAAKSMIYSNGKAQSDEVIYANIINKINVPNWRVPLSMTFGILSKLSDNHDLFNNLLKRLLTNEQTSMSSPSATLLIPFIIIDSLNDMSFQSKQIECQLIQRLADLLLIDYENMSAFARLKEHQELIHSYFFKLKQNYEETMTEWFMVKINHSPNLAACAKIAYQLKWYQAKFHQIFLNNLHHDCGIWNWPIDTLLRFYSDESKHQTALQDLKCRNMLKLNSNMVECIVRNQDWLRLITALYGGQRNYNTPMKISEFYEISHFLSLNDKERMPFIFYYQEVWGKEEPTYRMTVHCDTGVAKNLWDVPPVFEVNTMYKESVLTEKISALLLEGKPAMELTEAIRMQINDPTINISDKVEGMIALVSLGDFDFIGTIVQQADRTFIQSIANRIEQLICVLKDPIARCSSFLSKYLLTVYNDMQDNSSNYNVNFIDYCKIYLSLSAKSGGLPIDVNRLAEAVVDIEEKCDVYGEYLASKFTGSDEDTRYAVAMILDEYVMKKKSKEIIKSFLKINDAVQLYRPVRGYAWPLDTFLFSLNNDEDIPIAFFNCLENINVNIAFTTHAICEAFNKDEDLSKNSDLIPLMISFVLNIMSKDFDLSDVYQTSLPEIVGKIDIKEFILEKIQSMSDPYYKSRALYQLAGVYDAKRDELLYQSFALTKYIVQPVQKFQVLEKIYNVFHYKETEHRLLIGQVIDELIITWNTIEDLYDRVIASIRLSFYGSREFRHKYLAHALHTLMQMNEDDQQVKLIIKMKPLIRLFDDLYTTLNVFIEHLNNKTHQHLIHGQHGKILSAQKSSPTILDEIGDLEKKPTVDYIQLQALFTLFAQLNDMKSMAGEIETIDQLWINLFKDPQQQSNVAKILEIGVKTELFLTPSVAIILDELVRQGKEDCISVLFPYIVKPSQEVLPVVQRWLMEYKNKLIGSVAALLLAEGKYVFESGVDLIVDLLCNDNDQLRYRAQRVFQHPERDVDTPSKRISIIGERTMMKILQNIQMNVNHRRVQTYLNSFFYDLLWDDAQIFLNLYEQAHQSELLNSSTRSRARLFNKMKFININTWNAIMQSVQSSSDSMYIEEIFESIMVLTQHDQITADQWREFVIVLSTTDLSQFREKVYFSSNDVEIMQFIFDEVCALTDVQDETYFEILQCRLISELTVPIEELVRSSFAEINHIRRCHFFASNELLPTVLNILHNTSLTSVIFENLIQWLLQIMSSIKTSGNTSYLLMLTECILSLVAACARKDDYLYRKVTNASHFNKHKMSTLLEKMIHEHPFFPARGSAFILLAALDQIDHRAISNAMNTLFDENLVKEYTMVGISLIHLSPNVLLHDLLSSLNSESAVKTYEILKIFTRFVLNETIDTDGKSKIINYLAEEIGQLKSKKPISYYYTDIKLPFTTTVENELYKAWIKIQGLSGKTQYCSIDETSS